MTTEYSIQKMVSDGTLSVFALGIEYLQRNDIYMRIAGEETPSAGAPNGYTWSFVDNTTIKILPVVPNGIEVVVYRRTDADAMYNVYSQNAQFDEATIDENNTQLLFLSQEYLEQGAGIEAVEYIRSKGNVHYYRLQLYGGNYTDEFTITTQLPPGYERGAGDFVTGFTVLPGMRNVAWLNPSPTGDNNLYSWSGEVPPSGKVVPPNSTPETTGGFVNGWVPRTDEVLRSDLSSFGGAGLITDTLKPVTWSGFAGGADKTGAIDSQAAFDAAVNAAKTQGTGIFVPKGTYKSGATLYDIQGDGLWLNKDFPGGINIPATLRGNCLLLTIANPDVPTKDPIYTRSALNISAVGQGANHCNAIRLKMLNYSTDTDGNTGVYAESVSADTGKWTAALHGEAHHAGGTHIGANVEAKSHTTLGALYGIVVLNTGGDPTALHPVTGLPPVANPNAVGIYINGGAGNGDAGLWLYGVKAGADSIRAGGAVIRDEARTGAYGYRSTTGAVKTTAEIFLEGVAPTAIVLNGTYSTGNAIRLRTGDAVAFDATGSIKIRYDSVLTRMGFFSGTTEMTTFGTTLAGGGVYVEGVRVVKKQQPAITNAAAGTEVATINSVLSALRSHGLIAT